MPMERFQVRNEFGLGKTEHYTQAVKEEDPKLILDGLTVSGLVGILRQLGDLVEFAAEVFHGLQEDAMKTASRSQKLMVRVQNIEATFPALEKAALGQTSHIHFAYTAGSDWHARIHNSRHHFIENDLPRFIMDYYEECRDPPRLHLLDKFDIGGPGSCLRRYSDPSFFRSTSAKSDKDAMKIRRDKKACKIKKKRSFTKKGEVSRALSTFSHSGRMQLTTEAINGQDSAIASMSDLTFKSDVGNRLSSFDSRTGSSYIECIFHPSSEMQPEEQKTYNLSSPRKMQQGGDDDGYYSEVIQEIGRKSSEIESFDQIAAKPPNVIWDEKTEILESEDRRSGIDQASVSLFPKSNLIHSDHFDEVTGPVNPKTPQTSSGDNFVSRPHSDIWYEKTDIVKLENGESCQEEGLVTVSMRSDLDAAQREMYAVRGVDFDQLRQENTGELDVQSHDHRSKSFYNENELDDTGSERDNFEDALNTIESEYESDLDSKTKQSAEQSSVDNKEVKSVVHELPSHNTCAPPSNNGSGNASSVLSKEVSPDSPKSLSLEADFAPESKSEAADDSALLGSLPRFDDPQNGDVHDGPKVEFDSGEPSPTPADEIRSSFGNLQDLTAEEVKFWTNGGLLGLAPAKPPDFAAANAVHQDSVVKIRDILQTEHRYKLNDDKCEPNIVCSAEKANGREKEGSPKFSVPCSISQDSVSSQKSPSKESQGVPYPNFSESNDVNTSNKLGYTSRGGMGSICVVAPGSALPVAPTVKAACTEAIQENNNSSSGVFVFGQKFLVNSFRKKLSLVLDENMEPVSPIETNFLEQSRGHHNNSHQTPQGGDTSHLDFETVSPIHSLPPSPPIGHMNISFQPVNRIEASQLRLKLPGGESRQENNGDLYAAFQLVPEHAVPLNDDGSDTDDNTFCRSSYVSDDCLSHHSDSDSEDWGSSETPEGKGGDQFDAFCGLSTESSSSSLENGRTESFRISGDGSTGSPQSKSGVEPTIPFSTNTCATFDLPSFDSINSALNKVNNALSDPKSPLESPFSNQQTPPPPPLPPMQWRLLKSCSDRGECEQTSESKCTNNSVESMLPGSDVSSRPRKISDKDSHNNLLEEIIAVTMKRKELQKLNSEKDAYQVAKFKEMDEKEEFLQQIWTNEQQNVKSNTEAHPVAKVKEMDENEDFLKQIRMKSFNLRPTAIARPLVTTASTTNTKVTAILEKANAIRQAVGSDDGDDDDDDGDDIWSDN